MTDNVLIFRLLHFLGNIFWLGGAVTVAVMAAGLAGSAERLHAAPARRAALTLVTPGMVLAWVGGLGMLLPNWSDFYAKQGWMHGKITIALVVAALTGVLTGRLRRAVKGEGELKPRLLSGMAWTILFLVVVAVGLGVFKPGG